MPSIRGEAVQSCQISTDDATDNLKELRLDLLQGMVINKGVVAQQRTRGGDAIQRYDKLKADPSIELIFDPEMSEDRAYRLVVLTDADDQVFDIKIGTDTQNEGLHVSGKCVVLEPTTNYDSATGEATIRCVLRGRGEAWTFDTAV